MSPYPAGNDSDVQGANRSLLSNCPECPEIKKKIDRIFEAILGDDGLGMKNGIVFELTALKATKSTTDSWVGVVKPIAVSVAITAVTTFLAIKFL
jgi:hypothetical protein